MACLDGIAWWKDHLANDIHAVLKAKEENIPTYYGLTPYISARKYLVDWLALIREKLHLQETTYHLAVYLLDYFLEGTNSVKYEQLHLVALSSLLIAAKLEESCERVPSLSVLNSFIPKPKKPELPAFYCRSEYMNMELTLLKHFQWNILKPTTAHFLSYYMSCSVFKDDLHDGMPIQSADCMHTCLENYKDYFQDVSLQYPIFRTYPPSVVAAACLATSRICIQLTPAWPQRLQTLTGCCLEELLPCVHSLLGIHNKDLAADEADN